MGFFWTMDYQMAKAESKTGRVVLAKAALHGGGQTFGVVQGWHGKVEVSLAEGKVIAQQFCIVDNFGEAQKIIEKERTGGNEPKVFVKPEIVKKKTQRSFYRRY